jgi:hypothetical protein
MINQQVSLENRYWGIFFFFGREFDVALKQARDKQNMQAILKTVEKH